jgi:hypothetical protein
MLHSEVLCSNVYPTLDILIEVLRGLSQSDPENSEIVPRF